MIIFCFVVIKKKAGKKKPKIENKKKSLSPLLPPPRNPRCFHMLNKKK